MTANKGIEASFKDSEVGEIPCDWNIRNLGSLVDRERGIRYGIVQPGKFDPSGRLLIRGQDYSRGWVDASEMFRVGDEVERRYRNARVVTNDLIITIVGASTGEVAKVPDWLQGANLTQTTARVAVDPQQADTDFVYHVLRSQFGASNVANYLKGGAQPGLNCGDVEKFILPIPDKRSEQQAIAEALSDADGLIEGLERLIAKKRLIKQGAMQDLLTAKRRLPGFSGEWVERKLGAVIMLQRGFDLPNSVRKDGDYPVVYSNGIMATHAKYMCEGPGVVTGRSGTIGNVTYVEGQYWPHNTALWVKNFFGNNARFIFYLLQFVDLRRFASGSGVPTLNRNDAHDDLIQVPLDVEEQEAISSLLDDLDAETQALETRLVKARQVKEGMMQNLLTGRIRLV